MGLRISDINFTYNMNVSIIIYLFRSLVHNPLTLYRFVDKEMENDPKR
jgi:hypothetical protein